MLVFKTKLNTVITVYFVHFKKIVLDDIPFKLKNERFTKGFLIF